MEPNKRTVDFHRASSFNQQSNCKSPTLSSKLSRGMFPFPSVLSSLNLPSPVPLPMLHPWNYASPQLRKFPSHYSKKQGFCWYRESIRRLRQNICFYLKTGIACHSPPPLQEKGRKLEERWLCYSYSFSFDLSDISLFLLGFHLL